MPVCHNCGEHLEGDGFTTVYHCPNVEPETDLDIAPDSNPVYCTTDYDGNLSDVDPDADWDSRLGFSGTWGE